MGAVIQVAVTLVEEVCRHCGGVYALNQQFLTECRNTRVRGWTCPYCKTGWSYTRSELDKLRDEVAAERDRLRAALSRENEAIQEKLKLERQLKRLNRGVCPHCNRTFQNIAKHMACKHPEQR